MLVLKAPAKINWFLRVLRKREDGFHDIESLIQKVSLYDTLSLKPSRSLTLSSGMDVPVEKNLVYRAAVLLQNASGFRGGAEIILEKRIPSEAGLGGGSSDAAATLSGLNALWSLGLSQEELCSIAAGIGSDVPFFLKGPLSFVEGRGEKVSPCCPLRSQALLIVKPPVSVPTHRAYSTLDSYREKMSSAQLTKERTKADNNELLIRAVENALISNDLEFRNDLEEVVCTDYPVIRSVQEQLYRSGAVLSLMSGSGSAVFGVFSSSEHARSALKNFHDCWTAAVTTITD